MLVVFMEVSNEKNIGFVNRFVEHCCGQLGLSGNVFVVLHTNSVGFGKSAGSFDPNTKTIRVCINNRALADVLRTLAHELTHLKQHTTINTFPEDDEELQPFEDEANLKAGRLVRFYGRTNPEIYWDLV